MFRNTPTLSASRLLHVTIPRRVPLIFAISLTLALSSVASVQGQQLGLTVQLPTVRNFSVQTAVSVPDGGTVSLGGISRSAEGRVSNGIPGFSGRPFRNDAIGRSTNSGRATVKTRVIVQSELEEDLLAEAERGSLTRQAKDYLNGKTAQNPLATNKAIVSGMKNRPTRLEGQSHAARIEKFASFLAANVGRRR